jgi:hypothetical protein
VRNDTGPASTSAALAARAARALAVLSALAILPALAAAPAASASAAAPAGGPSGIGLAAGGPAVLASAADYAKALTSPDWTSTPDGLVYDSCVYQIPQGATLDTTRDEIVLASGATRKLPADCRYPRLVQPAPAAAASTGTAAGPAAAHPDYLDEIFDAQADWPALGGFIPFNGLEEQMAVPAAPSPGATDYLFSGFYASAAAQDSFLESVIGYGPTSGGGSKTIGYNSLWIASYYVWSGGVAVGSLRAVSASDTIQTHIWTVGSTGAPSNCASDCSWIINTFDETTGHEQESTLRVKSTPAYTELIGGGLASNGKHCDQLFPGGHGAFRHIADTSTQGSLTLSFYRGPFTQCSASFTGSTTSLDLFWKLH